MRLFVIVLLCLWPSAVFAEEKPLLCKLLSVYQPSDDVAYKAGVDVNGKPVVPADINSSAMNLPPLIKIPLQVQLAERLQRFDDVGIKADAQLGLLSVHQDGRVEYDGKDISNSASAVCGLSHEIKEDISVNATETSQSDNGQKDSNPIQSEPVVKVKQLSVSPTEESDILQGGEHRE